MPESRLEYLFGCYVNEKYSPDEEKELMALLAQSRNERDIKELIDRITEDGGAEMSMPDQVAASILQRILQKEKANVVYIKSKKTIFKPLMRMVAAALVILFISGISYLILTKENKDNTIIASVIPSDKTSTILPGGNHAILTMADGSKIDLESVQKGSIQHGNATINKQNGLLVYEGSVPSKAGESVTYKYAYNSLRRPIPSCIARWQQGLAECFIIPAFPNFFYRKTA